MIRFFDLRCKSYLFFASPLLFSLLLAAGMLWPFPVFIQVFLLIIFLLIVFPRNLVDCLFWFSVFGLMSVALLYLDALNAFSVAALIVAIGFHKTPEFFYKRRHSSCKTSFFDQLKINKSVFRAPDVLVYPLVLSHVLLLLILVFSQSSTALRSPFEVLPTIVFVLYGLVSFLLLFLIATKRLPDRWFIWLFRLQVMSAVLVVVFVYAEGFGFDPFLHRAVETTLFNTGSIRLTSPLYAGQYGVVAALAHLTQMTIKTIDVWFTPLLVIIFLPTLGFFGLTKGWLVSKRTAQIVLMILLTIPYGVFTFTVPHNTAVVIFLFIIFQLPLFDQKKIWFKWLIISSFSILIHPLFGVPSLILVALSAPVKRSLSKKEIVLLFVIAVVFFATSLPVLVIIYNIIQGLPWIQSKPWEHARLFFELYRDPFVSLPGPWFLRILYGYRSIIVFLPALILLIPIIFWKKDHLWRPIITLVACIFGLTVASFLLRTAFVFKDIISYEQAEFALRVIAVLPFATLPVLAHLLMFGTKKIPQWNVLKYVFIGICTFSLLSAWYVSYPQFNEQVHVWGPGVGGSDFVAAQFIEEREIGRPHIVLANQMMAASAVETYGFKRYVGSGDLSFLWYPIPTGGSLYGYFSQMAYVYPSKETMEEALKYAGVSRGYFVVHAYWPNADWLADIASTWAQESFYVNGGDVLLFFYQTP